MKTNDILRINEIFTSIQGEGLHTGRLMHFIRLAGCNLKCNYCDTSHDECTAEVSINEISARVSAPSFFPVYITGGEPLLQDATLHLLIKLIADGKEVHLDTNGSLNLEPVAPKTHKVVDIKTPGSGAGNSFLEANLKYISATDEIKFVVTSKDDFDWAIEFIDKFWLMNITQNIFIQPAWGLVEYTSVIEWLKECPIPLRLSAQIHKFIWSPDKRGV